MKKIIIACVVLLIGIGIYFFTRNSQEPVATPLDTSTSTPVTQNPATTTPKDAYNDPEQIIGTSVENRNIVAYHFGTGTTELLFIGGIHGGYEWNTALVAYEMINYLKQNPTVVPANLKVTVIPVLNPDGLQKVVGTTSEFKASDVTASQATQVAGRFNAHNVDLNRNFDCDWQAEGKWQDKTVSGGASAFSEPESIALRNYVEAHKPAAVVAWYSAAGGVYASNCHSGVSAETSALTKVFADASLYPAHQDFNFYEITGDMVNWFAKNNIPAISVLLTNHTSTEWSKNKAGIDAVIKHYTR